MRRKRRKTNVKVVDERNKRFKADLWHDVDEIAGFISDLDIDDDAKNYIMEGVNEIADLATALLNQTELPKRLRYPFNPKDAN